MLQGEEVVRLAGSQQSARQWVRSYGTGKGSPNLQYSTVQYSYIVHYNSSSSSSSSTSSSSSNSNSSSSGSNSSSSSDSSSIVVL